MIYTKERVEKMNVEEISKAIKELETLYNHLGGTLYPGIVSQEINFLYEQRRKLCTNSS
jgi:signal recognition particle subunit SEC65